MKYAVLTHLNMRDEMIAAFSDGSAQGAELVCFPTLKAMDRELYKNVEVCSLAQMEPIDALLIAFYDEKRIRSALTQLSSIEYAERFRCYLVMPDALDGNEPLFLSGMLNQNAVRELLRSGGSLVTLEDPADIFLRTRALAQEVREKREIWTEKEKLAADNRALWEQVNAFFHNTVQALQEGKSAGKTTDGADKLCKVVTTSYIHAEIYDDIGMITAGCAGLFSALVVSLYDDIDFALVGASGEDVYGRILHNAAAALPIDVSCFRSIPYALTGRLNVSQNNDGNRIWDEIYMPGVEDTYVFCEEDIKKIKAADYVLVYGTCGEFCQLLNLRKNAEFQLAVDWNEYTDFQYIESTLWSTSFAFFAAERRNVEDMEKRLLRWSEEYDCIFVMTMGEQGSIAFQNGISYRTEAYPVERVVDTNGCGDYYRTAFICSYARDRNIETAMREGSRVAAVGLSQFGLISRETFLKKMENMR